MDKIKKKLKQLNSAQLRELAQFIDELREQKRHPTGQVMRTFDEFQQERNLEVAETNEDLMHLKEDFLENGRQFKLSVAQMQVIERYVGKLAHPEVTVYDVLWDGLQAHVLEFSIQCNIPRSAKRRGLVSAYAIRNAQNFFREVKQLEESEEFVTSVENKEKKNKSKEKVINLAEEYLK